MAHTPQEIFKVIAVHNRLLTEADADQLLAENPDPEAVIDKMVMAEMINHAVAEKLRSAYQKNLQKSGLVPVGAGVPSPALPPAPSHPPAAHAAAPAAHAAPHVMPAAVAPPHAGEIPTPANAIIHRLLKFARDSKASDVHIKSASKPFLRLTSVLREIDLAPLPPDQMEAALISLLSPHDREVFFAHNDIDFGYDGGPGLGRFRVSLVRHFRGIDGVFRVIPEKLPDFQALNLPAQIKKMTQYRQGIVLVTGPKGSGKTTTLAALIDLINTTRAEHIITIEDPIEFVHPSKKGHVNQREVGPHTKTFSTALRSALREAPDVIMVGEMRDLETTSLAITAAETGHLVLATLHTADAAKTIGRVLDIFPPEEQGQIRAMFSESLRGIVSQLLIPDPTGNAMHLAYEILFNTPAIANLIRDNRAFQLKGVMQTHRKQGMCTMDDTLLALLRAGKINKHEALIRADNPALLERDLTHDAAAVAAAAAH